jgi:hypothetical protein
MEIMIQLDHNETVAVDYTKETDGIGLQIGDIHIVLSRPQVYQLQRTMIEAYAECEWLNQRKK